MISTIKSKVHGFAFLYSKNTVSNLNVSDLPTITIYRTTMQNSRSFRLIKL